MSTLRHIAELARSSVPPMHPAGRPFVLGGAAATLLAGRYSRGTGIFAAAATLGTALFFRDPVRVPPERPGVVAAAADGTVSLVDEAAPPVELGLDATPRPRVSVFLSVLDVHVQRAPCTGRIRTVAYHPGQFLSADLDKASDVNERNSVVLDTDSGHELVVVQIAGLIARRIVCERQKGDEVTIGETYGLIRFGSRVDHYFPAGTDLLVRPGQRTVGGETVLAQLPGTG